MPGRLLTRRSTGAAIGAVVGGLIVLGLVWAGIDLWAPRSTDIRSFDPAEVARIETAMWRSYYDRQRLRLFGQLAELLRTQYRLTPVKSHLAAYQAARAAFTFKSGGSREEYERVLPNLVRFYASIRRGSRVPFDADRAARLELEWWIVHREPSRQAPGELARALAELQAEIYRVPVERLAEHASLRAEAMTIRDEKALAGGLLEGDWKLIEERLLASWQDLFRVVNEGMVPAADSR
jgi:hypothetical protein